ncbi:oxysterol-binding protein-related protein 9-like isoform X2 [Anneissia japonica]|uniref:oxysterol-binding protein-related protein 9-like isoform X2 n=1 Tax=Anneissia japonica TaxID=1529436 RepID=UPI0014259E4F|nr:oxysterol-binding protein-related protein 9-like isoform X2 [Anneissia japonica]
MLPAAYLAKWQYRATESPIDEAEDKLQLKFKPPKDTPSINDFEKKLAEADAYLQLLINQTESLEAKMSRVTTEVDRPEQDQVLATAKGMIESIKQAIVLLQVAKTSLYPINGIIQGDREGESGTSAEQGSMPRPTNLVVTTNHNESTTKPPVSTEQTGVESPIRAQLRNDPIPTVSYSSSEDEEFFDVDEYQSDDNKDVSKKVNGAEKERAESFSRYDESEDEDDVIDCEKHGSVITHLLSQVRLGMDLTKVVLPTFILETRSTLEMYADFFAHADLFSTISSIDDPKDRMFQVLRWYLSALSAGRKGSVAKKPYNPIIGETFLCYWDVDPENTDQNDLTTDGPLPWAPKDSVTFIAEQVSHHPPISAFYAECYNTKMAFNAHLWTKSKFLGLSIGVDMIGQACASDLKHEEDYFLTFPSGYGRSILTVPWFEMGGKGQIVCNKTGFSANITFHTKPFYGGKRHRISAEVVHVSDPKKPILSVQGEWNGVMCSKGPNGKYEEPFVDTKSMKIIKKKVKPMSSQGEYESRRLWKDVTFHLKAKDMEKATEGKRFLEQRQRDEAKERKETGTVWKHKHFHEDGEIFAYNHRLQSRLLVNKEESAS